MRRKPLVSVWRDAVRDSPLRSTPKLVGLVLSTYLDGRGMAWPSRNTLAAGAGLSDRAVDSAITTLKREGFLQVEHSKGRRPNVYQATLPATANELRRSEWATANLATSNSEPRDTNSERRSPESFESAGKPGAAASTGAAPVEECFGCGSIRELLGADFHYCVACSAAAPAEVA